MVRSTKKLQTISFSTFISVYIKRVIIKTESRPKVKVATNLYKNLTISMNIQPTIQNRNIKYPNQFLLKT